MCLFGMTMKVATASSAGTSSWTKAGERIRAIQSCKSDDFIHWTQPEPHVYNDGVPIEHFYTNATMPCPGAEHILLSFPMRFVPERTKDTEGMSYPGGGVSDAVFMTSRDGVHWDRTFMDAWLRPGLEQRNWTHRSQTPGGGTVPDRSGRMVDVRCRALRLGHQWHSTGDGSVRTVSPLSGQATTAANCSPNP